MKLTKKQKEWIEEICGDIYDVGHAHGWNVARDPPKRVNEGWFKYYKKLVKFIENE